MKQMPQPQSVYGFPGQFTPLAPPVIVSDRAPTVYDRQFPIGQLWIAENQGLAILIGKSGGQANWVTSGGNGPGGEAFQQGTDTVTTTDDTPTVVFSRLMAPEEVAGTLQISLKANGIVMRDNLPVYIKGITGNLPGSGLLSLTFMGN